MSSVQPTNTAMTEPSSATAARVLFVTEWFLPYVGGSVNLYVETYRRFPAGSVHVLTGIPDERATGPESPLPTTRVSLQRYTYLRPESLAMYIRLWRAAKRLIGQHGAQVIHGGHVFPEGLIAYTLRRLTGTPYLVYSHGEEIAIQSADPWKRKLMPVIFNNAGAVIANSSNTRRLLESVGVESDRIKVVNPAIDTDRFTPGPRDSSDELRLLTVGRLQTRKGHGQVLKAVAKLRDRFPKLRYEIAGTGEEELSLRREADELGLGGVVRFLGYVPDDDLPDLYRRCDVFVMANRELADHDVEGFGMVFLEAAACERPVVGGLTGGVPEAVDNGRNGFLVDTEDIDQLAGALGELLGDPEKRAAMGARGVEWAHSRFSWDDFHRQVRQASDRAAEQTR